MTTTEIKNEIERIDKAIFIEHMANFLNWEAVRKLEKEKRKLEELLNITHEPKPESEYDRKVKEQWAKEEEERIKRYVDWLMRD